MAPSWRRLLCSRSLVAFCASDSFWQYTLRLCWYSTSSRLPRFSPGRKVPITATSSGAAATA
eukprot:7312170-Alexandrium_andersonii.AAC.1